MMTTFVHTDRHGAQQRERVYPNVTLLVGRVDPDALDHELRWVASAAARDALPLRVFYRRCISEDWRGVVEVIERYWAAYPSTRVELSRAGIDGIASWLLSGEYVVLARPGAPIALPRPTDDELVGRMARKLMKSEAEAARLMSAHSTVETALTGEQAAALGIVTLRHLATCTPSTAHRQQLRKDRTCRTSS